MSMAEVTSFKLAGAAGAGQQAGGHQL